MNNNLVPTVITDVNGRTTTVHKKLFETPTSPWSTPPPPGGWNPQREKAEPLVSPYSKAREDNPIGAEDEREETLSAISRLIADKRMFSGNRRYLVNCKDGDYLKRVHKAIASVSPDEEITLATCIAGKDHVSVNVVCNYHDLVTDTPSRSLSSILQLHKNLLKEGICDTDQNGCIKAFEAHLYARDHTLLPAGHTRMGEYGATVDNEDYVALVDKYADSVVPLVAYVSERGFEDFDHDEFAEYLSNGPIAGGWL